MFLVDLLGAGLTLVAIGFLLLGGYLAALRLLGEEAGRDPLALAIASLLLATAEAVGIGLLLGALGLLRIDLALALQAMLSLLLLVGFRRSPPPGGIGGPARAILRRAWAILREHPALSLVTLHAVGSEALRGLLPPAAVVGQPDVPPAARRHLAARPEPQPRLRQHPGQLLRLRAGQRLASGSGGGWRRRTASSGSTWPPSPTGCCSGSPPAASPAGSAPAGTGRSPRS